MSTSREIYLRISPDKFHILKFILEGYDNLAILSSHDMAKGIVRIRYISDSSHDLFELLSSLAPKLA
jgi:hypothetical protein